MELLVSTHSDSYWSGVFFYFYIKQVFMWSIQTNRQTDRYFIDRKKVNPDLFVIEIRERYVHVYTTLLIS